MQDKKPTLDSLIRGGKYCIKCGSQIKKDDIGHRCEIIECPKTRQEKTPEKKK